MLLGKLGVPSSVAGKIDTLILVLLLLLVIFMVAEIVYRVAIFLSRRIQKRRHYLFLEKVTVKKRLRKIVYILPPIMISSMLPFVLDSGRPFFIYAEHIVWIYFVIAVVVSTSSVWLTKYLISLQVVVLCSKLSKARCSRV